jgi:DNA (cytosine-5)-methyltransferase 1
VEDRKEIKYIELFAGIGGFRYGLEEVHDISTTKRSEHETQDSTRRGQRRLESKPTAGLGYFECVYTNEWDKYASSIYERHYEKPDTRDIREVKEIPDHDLLTAGFPCQAFSVAGKRGGFEDTRGTLFFEIARIAKQKQPRLLLLENVKGLLSHDKGKTFATILNTLDELGYDCQWQVLNSKDFGVPQNRERVFIIGHLRGTSRPEVFPIGGGNGKDIGAGGLYEIHERRVSQSKNGQEKKQYTRDSYNKKGGKGSCNKRSTSTAIRRLTPTECERLQGFPDGWTEGISDTQRYKCLGNAVTTNVITAIGKRL